MGSFKKIIISLIILVSIYVIAIIVDKAICYDLKKSSSTTIDGKLGRCS